MLSLQFYHFNYFLPAFLLFFISVITLCLNYLFYFKNFLFYKLRDKVKIVPHNEVTPVDSNILDFILATTALLIINFYDSVDYIKCTSNILLTKFGIFTFMFVSLVTFALNYYCKHYLNNIHTVNYNSYIGIIAAPILFFTTSTQDFMLFFLFVEIFGYLFYFQFLQAYSALHDTKATESYIDSLLLYYWVNFFGGIIMMYSIALLFFRFNTTNFIELFSFYNCTHIKLPLYVFVLGFSIKMGVPGFHFLKVEIYKNLKLDAIINFSFFSTCGYLSMLSYITSYFLFIFNFNLVLLFLFIFILVFIVPNNLRIINIILFFGYSAILNLTICVFLFF